MMVNAGKGVAKSNLYTFFKRAYQAFQKAEGKMGANTHYHLTLGPETIELRFAGPALVSTVIPALMHLAASAEKIPELTVYLWDCASTNTAMPAPPWSPSDYGARGEINGYNDERIFVSFQMGTGTLSMLDMESGLALFWVRDADRLPYYEKSAPLRTILHWWMRHRGWQMTHAAAVGSPSGGVLMVGKGGAGKSTTTLACLNSELAYVGDDYCLLGQRPTLCACSIYNSAKLDSKSVRKLARFTPAVTNPGHSDDQKAVLLLNTLPFVNITLQIPIQAILVLRITRRTATVLKPTSHSTAVKAVATSTIFQLSHADRRDLMNLCRIVRQVPAFELEVGTQLAQIPGVILNLLHRIQSYGNEPISTSLN